MQARCQIGWSFSNLLNNFSGELLFWPSSWVWQGPFCFSCQLVMATCKLGPYCSSIFPMDDLVDSKYDVEDTLNSCTQSGYTKYLVKWLGYPDFKSKYLGTFCLLRAYTWSLSFVLVIPWISYIVYRGMMLGYE